MGTLIKGIKIPDKAYSFTDCDGNGGGEVIENISKINIFVGANNTGKSRLIRTLLSTKEFSYLPAKISIEEINEFIRELKNQIKDICGNRSGLQNILNNIDAIENIEFVNDSFKLLEQLDDLKTEIKNVRGYHAIYSPDKIENDKYVKASEELMSILERCISKQGEDFKEKIIPPVFTKIYIPILRGLKYLKFSRSEFHNDDFYKSRTFIDYFKEGLFGEFEIFTGITVYEEIKTHLLGNLDQRKLVKEYEKYLSKNFFDNEPIALIPSENGELTIKIGEEKEQPIYNLGDGIQSIIIITMPLFLNRGKNLLVFIEEPEQLMHPELQRKLIETFLNQEGFENYQYFVTTHSNHFLDITLDFSDISIYSLKKEFDETDEKEKTAKFFIENLSHGDSSSLELLGVRNSSVFLSNCTIWVEGITDRKYFRHYLGLYQKHLKDQKDDNFVEVKEDYHYSFVEYGGDNITHWSFLDKEDKPINVDRLCGKLFLIADKDEGKEERHKKLEEILGDRFYPLECREVENLLSKNILWNVIAEYEKVNDVKELEIDDFEESEYKDKPLGEFIEEKIKNRKRKGSYKEDSGTISNKGGFCEKAVKNIKQWDDLSDEAKKITEKLYQFIEDNNPK